MAGIASGASSIISGGQSIYSAAAANKRLVQFFISGQAQAVCVFDLSKQETYKHTAKATRFPTEGDNITDHVIVEPVSISLECLVTDTPLANTDDPGSQNSPSAYAKEVFNGAGMTAVSALAGPLGVVAAGAGVAIYNANSGTTPSPRSTNAYQVLYGLWFNKTLLDVRTKLDTYEQMVIEDLGVPRDASTGDALVFSISLTTINIVQSQSVNASDIANASLGSANADVGQQSAKAVDTSVFEKKRAMADIDIAGQKLF
jgi:hypothetical protein